jgi:O-antigen ligase
VPRRLTVALLAVPLLVPLVVHPSFLFPYVAPKVHLFRLAALAALGCAAWVRIRRPGPPPALPSGIALAGLAFLLSAGISAAAGVDPERSLWDFPDRMTGLYTFLCGAAWYAAASLALPHRRDWIPLLRLAVAAGAAACLWGAVQSLAAPRTGDLAGIRPGGPLGHGAFLGTTAVSTAFLAVLLHALSPAGRDRALALAGAGLGVGGVLASQSRGGLVSLAAGAAALLLARAAAAPPGGRERRACAALLLGGAAAAGLLFLLRDAPAVRALPGVGRLAATRLDEATVVTRGAAYDAAFAAAGKRPLLGWGPRNFSYVADTFYRPVLHLRPAAERWIDRAHCEPLDALAEQGLPGLALWLAVYGTAFLAAWAARERGLVDGPVAAAATAWIAARFAGNLLLFEDPSSLVHLVFFLGLLARLGAPDAPEAPAPPPGSAALRTAAASAVAVVLALLAWKGDLRPARAGLGVRAAADQAVRGEPGSGARMEDALGGGVAGAGGYRIFFGSLVARAVPLLREKGPAGAAEEAGRAAFEELGRAAREHPRDVRPALLRWNLVERLPGLRADRAAAAAAGNGLEEAARIAPRRPEVLLSLSDARLAEGDSLGAMVAALQLVNLEPSLGSGWVRVAAAQASTRDRKAARLTLERAAKGGAVFSPDDAGRILALDLEDR